MQLIFNNMWIVSFTYDFFKFQKTRNCYFWWAKKRSKFSLCQELKIWEHIWGVRTQGVSSLSTISPSIDWISFWALKRRAMPFALTGRSLLPIIHITDTVACVHVAGCCSLQSTWASLLHCSLHATGRCTFHVTGRCNRTPRHWSPFQSMISRQRSLQS